MKVLVIVLLAAVALAVMTQLARRSGVRRVELLRDMPGDDIIGEAGYIADRATVLKAPAEQVWPLLAELGKQRAAWYAPLGIGRLFSPQKHSRHRSTVAPASRPLQVGDIVPDWGPGSLQVAEVGPPRSLVYVSYMKPKKGEDYGFSWAHLLEPVSATECRLYSRLRVRRSKYRSQRLLSALLPLGGFFDYLTVNIMYAGLRAHVKK